jgi:hypothetical protein
MKNHSFLKPLSTTLLLASISIVNAAEIPSTFPQAKTKLYKSVYLNQGL